MPSAYKVRASDGAHIAVTDVGTGTPVLLIPGLGYGAWSFEPQINPLSRSVRVLAMDNRGTGQSDKPAGPYSIAQMADDAYAVLSQSSAPPARVVGTSMGGYIALTLAQRHPSAVESLVLIATTCGGPGSVGVPNETLRLWGGAINLGPEEYARATMPASFAPGWPDAHPIDYERLLALRLGAPTPSDAWLAQFNACATFLRTGIQAESIDVPITIVHGTEDRVVPYENANHVARTLPQASVTTLDGAGHLCWIERARLVNRIILGGSATA